MMIDETQHIKGCKLGLSTWNIKPMFVYTREVKNFNAERACHVVPSVHLGSPKVFWTAQIFPTLSPLSL